MPEPTPEFTNVEIRIEAQQAAGYPLELTVNSEQEFAGGYLDPSFLPWVASASVRADGERLFQWLATNDQFQQAWAEIRGQYPQRRLRLRLSADAPELHALPWECLRDASGEAPQDVATMTTTPFSRYLAGKWQPGSPIFKRPIKILFAVAAAENLDADYNLAQIDPDAEWDTFNKATADIADVNVDRLVGPCTLLALEEALRNGYHILHLVAHGAYSVRRQQTVLYLSDDANQAQVVDGADLAAMLTRQLADLATSREDKLRLVFLASCQTAKHNPADAFRAVAPALVRAGLPAVLAMQDLISVPAAQAFSQIFYRQLLRHGQVDLAANEARSSLLSADLSGATIPVLYLRLRSGLLFAEHGRVSSNHNEEDFWSYLLDYILDGLCTPFLGPRVNAGLLPPPETVAQALAKRHNYPLSDDYDLVKVAQFIALRAPGIVRTNYRRYMNRSLLNYLGLKPSPAEQRRYDRLNFSELVETLNWSEQILTIEENEIHHLLAELKLPLYMTTNFDNFLIEALRDKGSQPRQAGPRWTPQAEAEKEKFVIHPAPTPEQPLVFHLNGYDADPEQAENLVLSEDDYLAHFVRISRDRNIVLPMNILQMLSQHSFLFLGYSLDDWEFRVILQGLLRNIAKTGGNELHVGIQLSQSDQLNEADVNDYFQRYLGRFNIDIYWGTPKQFMLELHSRLANYDESWGSF